MAKKEKIDMMVEGGAAKADASLSQKLGPLKINIPDVLKKVNEKTASFKGMKIPVKLLVDQQTKEVEITVGTPPVSELLKGELKLSKGSGTPNKEKIANIAIEQLIKVFKMKQDSMLDRTTKDAVKYDAVLKQETTTVTPEKIQQLQTQLAEVQDRLKREAEKAKAEADAAAAATAATTPVAGAPAATTEAKPDAKGAAPAAGAKPEAAKPDAKAAAKPEAKAEAKKK